MNDKKLKLFIFKPSNKWNYCGGGAVFVANDVSQVKELANVIDGFEKHNFYVSESEVSENEEWNCWVLVGTFNTDEAKPVVVLFNYNYA